MGTTKVLVTGATGFVGANIVKPFDDSCARAEWGWKGRFGLRETVESFLQRQQRAA